MRKFFLVVTAILPLAAMGPALAQGVQTPSSPNATPPSGTVPSASGDTATPRKAVRHRRPARHRPAVSEVLPEQSVRSL